MRRFEKLGDKRTYVLKQINIAGLSPRQKSEAVNEAKVLSKLEHPYVVKYFESFIADNKLNIVMEYCDKGDLSKLLLNHRLSNNMNPGPFPENKIWKYFLQMCVGLNYIHKSKILHRDIKTMNIFITQDDDIRIGDLGVAKILSHTANFAHTMVGTPFYLSPQLCEEKPYNNKSDVWALGCVLYEMCTLRHPFDAVNQGALILKIIRGKYAPIPAVYSKTLKDIVDQCLLKDYKRRPSIHDILGVPEVVIKLQELGIQNKEEQIDPKLLMKAKEPPVRRGEAIKSKAELSAKANVSEVKRAHQLKQQEELNKYNDVLKRPPPSSQRNVEEKKESRAPDFQEFLAQRRQQQAGTPSSRAEIEKKQKPSSSPFSFIPKDISEFAKNAARKAVDKVSNMLKPEPPQKSPLPNRDLTPQLAHKRNNSDLAPNYYKPVLRSPEPAQNFENFKKEFTPQSQDQPPAGLPLGQRRVNSRGFIGYNNPSKQKSDEANNSKLELNMAIQGQKVDLQKRQPLPTPSKRKSDFINKQEFKDRSAEVKKPTISMLKNGSGGSRNPPSRVQSEGDFRVKVDLNEKNNLARFDPQMKKQESNKRLEEELKKRLIPQPLPNPAKKDSKRAKIEKKNKKKLTVQDLEEINQVKNLPDNPGASKKEERKSDSKKEERKVEIQKEEEDVSKMVKDFIEKGQQRKERRQKQPQDAREKEESKSEENSSFEQINDREEPDPKEEGGQNLAKLKSLATIKEQSIRFQDHEETKPDAPMMTYVSESTDQGEKQKKLQSGENTKEKAEEVEEDDELDESTAGIQDEKDSDEESFYDSNRKPFIRFNRSQIKVPVQDDSKQNFSSMLALPDMDDSESNRLSNLKFKKTGENSIPVIHNEEYQTQKLEVVEILGQDEDNSDEEEEKEGFDTRGAEGDEELQSLVFDHFEGNQGFCAEDQDSELEEEIDEDCNIIDEVQDFKEENYCIVEPDELFESSEDETKDSRGPLSREELKQKIAQYKRDIEKKRKRIEELKVQGKAGLGDKFEINLNFFKMKASCDLTRKDEEDIGKMMHSDAHLSDQIQILYKIVNFEIQLEEMEKKLQASQQQLINLD